MGQSWMGLWDQLVLRGRAMLGEGLVLIYTAICAADNAALKKDNT